MVIRLSERWPEVSSDRLLSECVPPPRFAGARFATYRPNPEEPSQAEALGRADRACRAPGQAAANADVLVEAQRPYAGTPANPAIYLDGGFGVGKTHLLASLWHESSRTEDVLHVRRADQPRRRARAAGGGRGVVVVPADLYRRVRARRSRRHDADQPAARPARRRPASSSRRPRTRCPTNWARAASRRSTSSARSRRWPPTSTYGGSTGPTTVIVGSRKRPSRGPTSASSRSLPSGRDLVRPLRRPAPPPGRTPPKPVRRVCSTASRRSRSSTSAQLTDENVALRWWCWRTGCTTAISRLLASGVPLDRLFSPSHAQGRLPEEVPQSFVSVDRPCTVECNATSMVQNRPCPVRCFRLLSSAPFRPALVPWGRWPWGSSCSVSVASSSSTTTRVSAPSSGSCHSVTLRPCSGSRRRRSSPGRCRGPYLARCRAGRAGVCSLIVLGIDQHRVQVRLGPRRVRAGRLRVPPGLTVLVVILIGTAAVGAAQRRLAAADRRLRLRDHPARLPRGPCRNGVLRDAGGARRRLRLPGADRRDVLGASEPLSLLGRDRGDRGCAVAAPSLRKASACRSRCR